MDKTIDQLSYYLGGTHHEEELSYYTRCICNHGSSVDGSADELTVMFRQISFAVIDEVTQDPVSDAEVYVDNVGYIENGGVAIVPLGSTIYHKARLGDTWSEKTSKEVNEAWAECTYEWNETGFSPPSYE
jgi:hypothetical protein